MQKENKELVKGNISRAHRSQGGPEEEVAWGAKRATVRELKRVKKPGAGRL